MTDDKKHNESSRKFDYSDYYSIDNDEDGLFWTNHAMPRLDISKSKGSHLIHGKSTEWYENGYKKSDKNYEDGSLVGGIKYYENGQKKSEGDFWCNEKYGKWTFWYDNGQKESEGVFDVDSAQNLNYDYESYSFKDKKWTSWHKNGQKKLEGSYVDGSKDGKWVFWHDNGQKKSKGKYEDGCMEGVWT